VQTLINDELTLAEWYANIRSERKTKLQEISAYLVADTWFPKRSFVDKVMAEDVHLFCRLRDDSDLHYLHDGKSTAKRGGPKKYQGKVEHSNIRKDYFTLESCDDQSIINSAIVYSKF